MKISEYGLYKRVRRLESILSGSPNNYPDNADGFMTALLGADIGQYQKDGGGYDVLAALADTAKEDWGAV